MLRRTIEVKHYNIKETEMKSVYEREKNNENVVCLLDIECTYSVRTFDVLFF